MRIYTKTGDDGTTGLLYGGRISKDDARVEAYGASDEAVAALGIARAESSGELAELILRLQRALFVAGAELATAAENRSKLKPRQTKITEDMTAELEALIDDYEARTDMPKEFVIPGESKPGAALDLARALVRRAERRAVTLARKGETDQEVVRYLNRLADLLFVLARHADAGFTPLHG